MTTNTPTRERDGREFPRTPVRLKVCLMMSEEGEVLAVTRDVSDGGLFVLLDVEKIPAIGNDVNVQVQGLPSSMDAPWIKMQVVRIETDGIGLKVLT